MKSDYDIDPDGDVLLILKESHDKKEEDQESQASSTSGIATPTSTTSTTSIPLGEKFEMLSMGNNEDSSRPTQKSRGYKLNETTTLDSILADANIEGIKIRVSSKHLTTSSPYFKERLSGCLEQQVLKSKGLVITPLFGLNCDALVMVLNIMHCQTRKVPLQLGINLLCDTALVVDYLGCHEAVQVFANLWINIISSYLHPSYDDDLIKWIWISWVFDGNEIFQYATHVAERESTGPLESLNLPIPKEILDKIEERRQFSVGAIIKPLYNRFELLLNGHECCDACDTLMIGSLLLQLKSRELYPAPQSPFAGLSFESILNQVKTIEHPLLIFNKWKGCPNLHKNSGIRDEGKLSLVPELNGAMDFLHQEIVGLSLDDFNSST